MRCILIALYIVSFLFPITGLIWVLHAAKKRMNRANRSPGGLANSAQYATGPTLYQFITEFIQETLAEAKVALLLVGCGLLAGAIASILSL